jgi:hypothetical protein
MRRSGSCSLRIRASVACMLSSPPRRDNKCTPLSNQPPDNLAAYFQRDESSGWLVMASRNSGKRPAVDTTSACRLPRISSASHRPQNRRETVGLRPCTDARRTSTHHASLCWATDRDHKQAKEKLRQSEAYLLEAQRLGHMGSGNTMFPPELSLLRRSCSECLAAILIERNRRWR